MSWYPDWQQKRDYRQAAREEGCTCEWDLGPHAHEITCPLYVVPGGVPSGFHKHLEGSRGGEDRPAPARPLVPDTPSSSPAAEVANGKTPRLLRGDRATGPVEDGQRESTGEGPASSPAGEAEYLEHLEKEHDEDQGRKWL